jgi:hypothetical protein
MITAVSSHVRFFPLKAVYRSNHHLTISLTRYRYDRTLTVRDGSVLSLKISAVVPFRARVCFSLSPVSILARPSRHRLTSRTWLIGQSHPALSPTQLTRHMHTGHQLLVTKRSQGLAYQNDDSLFFRITALFRKVQSELRGH